MDKIFIPALRKALQHVSLDDETNQFYFLRGVLFQVAAQIGSEHTLDLADYEAMYIPVIRGLIMELKRVKSQS